MNKIMLTSLPAQAHSFDWALRALWTGLLILPVAACGVLPTGEYGADPSVVNAPSPSNIAAPDPSAISNPTNASAKDTVQNWDQYRKNAARKIMASNPSATFNGELPAILASIPSLSVYVNADGTIKDIEVKRVPRFHPETVDLAIAAVRKAAPFSPAKHLPQPWVFAETFLYNDDLKFQLHTLQNP